MITNAISIRGLGKRYRLQHAAGVTSYRTLRDSVSSIAVAPLRRLRGKTGGVCEEFWALQDIDVDIQPGEVVGVVGHNGAGKSTLLKILSRITKPTVGEVDVLGRVGSLLEVGTGFHPELTGRENIFLNGSVLGMVHADIKRKLDEIVSFAEVERFLDTPVKRYSSGMYVRLAFAVAAHLEPEILIIDEVLAVGDGSFQKKCLGKLSDLSGGGRTVLFVSHNLAAVSALCDRAIWLEKGRVVSDGPSREIVDAYLRATAGVAARRVELKGHRRTCRSQPLQLTAIEWASGMPLRHGETARILIFFEVAEPITDVGFGIGFSVPGGNRVLTYDSDLEAGRLDIPCCGEFAIELEVDLLPLAPGAYSIDLAARCGDAQSLDYLPSCTLIDVSPGDKTPAAYSRHPSAGVRFGGSWKSLETGAFASRAGDSVSS